MHPLKPELQRLNIPDRVKRLPRDHRGFPIPWFVYTEAGKPDFRVVGPGKIERAVKLNLCWVCGMTLVRHKAFVLGPMCAVSRTTAEPPCHRSCAMFAVQACPFLVKPRMRRNEFDLPEGHQKPAGIPIWDNPGLSAVWITPDYALMPTDGSMLFRVGDPEEVRWMSRGKSATYQEVMLVLKQRLPLLIDIARDEGDDAVHALVQQIARVRQYLPPKPKDAPDVALPTSAAAQPAQQEPGAARALRADAPGSVPRSDGSSPAGRDRATGEAA